MTDRFPIASISIAAASLAMATGGTALADATVDTMPCRHLSASAAAKATGIAFVSATVVGRIRTQYDPVNACAYHTAGDLPTSVVVAVHNIAGVRMRDTLQEETKLSPGSKVVPVPGVGDEASFFIDGLHVRKGQMAYPFTPTNAGARDPKSTLVRFASASKL